MGNAEQLHIAVETRTSKIHRSDFRSAARQRRLISTAALLPLIFAAFLIYSSSNRTSDVTTLFDEYPPPVLHSYLADRQEEALEATDVANGMQSENDRAEPESRNDEPEARISGQVSSNLTTTARDKGVKSKDSEQESLLSSETSLRTLNASANDPSSGVKVDTRNDTKEANVEIEEVMKREDSGEIVEEAAAPPAARNISNGLASEGVCDLAHGNWVPYSEPPQYNSTCKYIQDYQNCQKNGRPDDGYLYWKWKPEHCELPRMDAAAFLNAMRSRYMVFAGDSIARNQFQSLLCVLSRVEDPEHRYMSKDGRDNIHHFASFNFTLSVRWSPYLVRIEEKVVTWPDNSTENVWHVYVDELDESWVKAAVGVDIVQLSTGQWWYRKARYMEKNISLGCHNHPSCEKNIGFADPYVRTLTNVMKGSLRIPGFNGAVVYRSFSMEHFQDGSWNSGGHCNITTPGTVPMTELTRWMYELQETSFKNAREELGVVAKERLRLLSITDLAQIRGDAHPNKYRLQDKDEAKKLPSDCLHWCLPGPIDTWNDLLVQSVHDVIFQ